ncbi:hypothetical protein [uncultured Gordonia sp.]|uniref:hypothetical protein n=1 Tax=uncultured Gordonia sp. TaxID=198437 RepID=UPI00258EDFE5|nr:hypothetical protein [uncultured Gordonia sp.]
MNPDHPLGVALRSILRGMPLNRLTDSDVLAILAVLVPIHDRIRAELDTAPLRLV